MKTSYWKLLFAKLTMLNSAHFMSGELGRIEGGERVGHGWRLDSQLMRVFYFQNASEEAASYSGPPSQEV
jgi:hypothetical protein